MSKFKLTEKKKKWVKQFKPTAIMRGKPLNYPATVEAKYIKDLEKLTRQVIAETEKEIRKIFSGQAAKQYFAADESVASQSRILLNKLFARLNTAIAKRSKTISMQMVNNTNKASASGLNSSLKELSGGLSIKTSTIGPVVSERLKASIDVNVDLIKSIQSKYLDGVKDAVNRSIQTGNG